LPIYELLLNLLVTLVAGALVFAAWVANRKRIAAETIGRADEQARRTLKDAERDAETHKKEALLDAKEKAHDLLMDADRRANLAKQAAATLEQTLARRESALAESGDFLIPKAEGAIGDDHIVGEIGEIVAGRLAARRADDEITLFKSLGIAVEDLAAARFLDRRARELGVGTYVELGGRSDEGA